MIKIVSLDFFYLLNRTIRFDFPFEALEPVMTLSDIHLYINVIHENT